MANEPNILESLIQEASDPETDPERLQELATSREVAVRRAAWKNPNLPEEAWRKALLDGQPEPWDNPIAHLYLINWLPREDDWRTLERAARSATEWLWEEPERCSAEGKQLLAAKVMEWWVTSEYAVDMIDFLGRWASFHDRDSEERKRIIRILVQCVKTTPNLTPKDLNIINSIEQWSKGLQQDLPKISRYNQSQPVRQMHQAITSYPFSYRFAVYAVLDEVFYKNSKDYDSQAHKKAKAEQNRFLADLIRQEMPVPPTAE